MINFEEDQAKVITKTENIQSLADQVQRLQEMQHELEIKEDDLKQHKKIIEHFLDVEKHRSISKKALKSLNKDKPFLGFIFRIIYLPTRIWDFISDIIWWNRYRKC